MAGKSVWNGIIIGIIAAVAIMYIATTLGWLSFLNTMMVNMSQWFIDQSWWPTTIDFLLDVNAVKYIFAGIIGLIIGLYVEYK